jgi:AcrR family transcriptional regulator
MLHLVSEVVNRSVGRRDARVAETERRIVSAARDLFLRSGYVAATLAAVAEHADVAERTVYVRFGTKARLLRRVMDVAVVGDLLDLPLADRDWMQRSLTAPTRDARIDALSRGARELMERLGPLIPVSRQAEAVEPEIAAAGRAARLATREAHLRFWQALADDGLLPEGYDVGWLGETAAVLGAADTYTLMVETVGLGPDEYEAWLRDTWNRLAAVTTNPTTLETSP